MPRKPFSLRRVFRALSNPRFTRRENFRINTLELEQREAAVRWERQLRTEDPVAFAKAGFYGGPFSGR